MGAARPRSCAWLMVLCTSLLLIDACSSSPESPKGARAQRPGTLQGDLRTTAAIHDRGVASPLGRLTLVRKGTSLCAIRFTAVHLGQAADAPSGSPGDEVPSAEYDWYFQQNVSSGFSRDSVRSGHASLSEKQNVGIGRLSFQRGSRTVRCGSIGLGWGYPTWLSLIVVTDEGMRWNGVEIAPTAWKDIHEVNLSEPGLRWYRHDDSAPPQSAARKPLEIPVTDLPGSR
jgi:hypothetical protein